MFIARPCLSISSPDAWSGIALGGKSKLLKLHQFLYLVGGKTYAIEIQQAQSGECLAHADNTNDPHEAIKSCNGKDVEDCLKAMIQELENKAKP